MDQVDLEHFYFLKCKKFRQGSFLSIYSVVKGECVSITNGHSIHNQETEHGRLSTSAGDWAQREQR